MSNDLIARPCTPRAGVVPNVAMQVEIGDLVMHPDYKPYPRYGRVVAQVDDAHVRVTAVQCGDPRCAAEHFHGDLVWETGDLVAATAYQPRAEWEEGRKSSPNAVVNEE